MKSAMAARRLRALIVFAAAAAFALAGCSATTQTLSDGGSTVSPQASGSAEPAAAQFPVTFTNADGSTTEIPAKPTTIVSTSVTLTGPLLSFDAPVVASSGAANGKFFAQWNDVAEADGVKPLFAAGAVDVEAVLAADPDLIVVASSGNDSAIANLKDFQAIAPTIVIDYGEGTWQDVTRKLAKATGLSDAAEKTISDFDAHVADVKSKITVPTGEANIISFNGPGESNPIGRASGPHAQLLTQLGFTIEDPNPEWHTQAQERNDFVWATYENLTQLKAETTFILSQDNEGAQAFATDPVMANVPSVVKKQVYGLGKNSFRIDYYSATEIVDSILANFAKV